MLRQIFSAGTDNPYDSITMEACLLIQAMEEERSFGRAEGRIEGKAEGSLLTLVNMVQTLKESMGWDEKTCFKNLRISSQEGEKILRHLELEMK